MKQNKLILILILIVLFTSACTSFTPSQQVTSKRGVVLDIVSGDLTNKEVDIGESIDITVDVINYGKERVIGTVTLSEVSVIADKSNLKRQQEKFDIKGSTSAFGSRSNINSPYERITFQPFRYLGSEEELGGKSGIIQLRLDYFYTSNVNSKICVSDIGERQEGRIGSRCQIQETLKEGNFEGSSNSPIAIDRVEKEIKVSDNIVSLKIYFANKGGGTLEGPINLNAELIGAGPGICSSYEIKDLKRPVVCNFNVLINDDPVNYPLRISYIYPYSSISTIKIPIRGKEDLENNNFNILP